MTEFFWRLDVWLFSPPYPFTVVLHATDMLLQASESEYAEAVRTMMEVEPAAKRVPAPKPELVSDLP
jgi:hypothetical protein